jgi:hypothetical protein
MKKSSIKKAINFLINNPSHRDSVCWYLAGYTTDYPHKAAMTKREQFREVIQAYVFSYEISVNEREHYESLPSHDSESIWAF